VNLSRSTAVAPALRDTEPNGLSRRELEVVWELALGRRAPEIAARLHISRNTVRSHIRNAMVKTGARSQAHLVAIALVGRLLDHDLLARMVRRDSLPPPSLAAAAKIVQTQDLELGRAHDR